MLTIGLVEGKTITVSNFEYVIKSLGAEHSKFTPDSLEDLKFDDRATYAFIGSSKVVIKGSLISFFDLS